MDEQPGTSMDVSVEIHCAACGSANYSLLEGEASDAGVNCNDCGRRLGSIAELKAAESELAAASDDAARFAAQAAVAQLRALAA